MRGLPILGWSEINFKNILSEYGSIFQYCKIRDEDDFYQNPKFLIETNYIAEIDAHKSVKLMNQSWDLRILETSCDVSILLDMDAANEQNSPCEDYVIQPF